MSGSFNSRRCFCAEDNAGKRSTVLANKMASSSLLSVGDAFPFFCLSAIVSPMEIASVLSTL